ncbi:MAG: nucleotide disphospho-sugar-binding domain-containing protein [Dehalococcoidia bacterium]
MMDVSESNGRKTVLFAMYDGGGNVSPLLAVAEELLARGHRVIVLGGPFFGESKTSKSLTERASALGCEIREMTVDDERAPNVPRQRGLFAGRTGRWFGPLQFTHSIHQGSWRWAQCVAELCRKDDIDVVAADDMLPGAMVGAESAGIPYCSLLHTVYFFRPAPGLPPPGMGMDPPVNIAHRIRDHVIKRSMSRVYIRDALPSLNAARSRVDLEPIQHPWEQHARAKHVIVLTSKYFDFKSSRLPQNVVYAGMPFARGAVARAQRDYPEERPTVLISLSTSDLEQTATAQAALDALAPLPVKSIITLTGGLSANRLKLPPNAEPMGFVPHFDLMPNISAVVTHGGHGTVLTALSHGKPIVCTPIYFDQFDIARRVKHSGAGVDVGRRHSVEAIRVAVQRVLSESTFTARAQAMAENLSIESGRERAASIIESAAIGVDPDELLAN